MTRTHHRPLRVVALGGGTGLPMILRGLKAELFPDGADDTGRLVAVVTVTDEGGSSGRLRNELGILPPGDMRNCLVALSHNEPLMAKVFQARYKSRGPLDGHSIGNLILAGLAQIEGDDGFLGALRQVSEVLNIQGQVYPSTLVPTRLVATLDGGTEVVGETAIADAGSSVEHLRLVPECSLATPGIVDAILSADVVVIGPGSLYTSILPNLLIPEIKEALHEASAFRLLLVNAMTEPGETRAFDATDHVRAVYDHAGEGILDGVLLAEDAIPGSTLARYRLEGAERVAANERELEKLVPHVAFRRLLVTEPKVRHDPARSARAVLECWAEWRRSGRSAQSGKSSARGGASSGGQTYVPPGDANPSAGMKGRLREEAS